MKNCKLLLVSSFFCLMFVFTACNSHTLNQEKNEATGTNNSDNITPQSSRDSIAKGTTVTPSPSAIPSK